MADVALDMQFYTQENRLLRIELPPDNPMTTSQGGDLLLIAGLSGFEAISRLFQLDLALQSTDTDIELGSILGQPAKLKIGPEEDTQRCFHGIISSFAQVGAVKDADGSGAISLAEYKATLVPWLWLLTRQCDCRIFQNLSVPEILGQIFAKPEYEAVAHFETRFHGDFPKREYCVQYRETDFNFISRLMEEEGIWYFFEHSEDDHVLVLTNHPDCADEIASSSLYTFDEAGTTNVITAWHVGQEIRPGKYTLRDYNFTTPTVDLTRSAENPQDSTYEMYDYPGEYDSFSRGLSLANLRIEEEETPAHVVSGSGFARNSDLACGSRLPTITGTARTANT